MVAPVFLGLTAAAWAGIGAVTSLAFGVYSAYTQAQQARQQAQFQRDMALRNATIAEQNVTRIQQEGEVARDEVRERAARYYGAARAIQGAKGFLIDDPNSTNVSLLADLKAAERHDLDKVDDKTAGAVRQARIQQDDFNMEASLFQLKADNSNASKAALGTLLAGAPKVAGKFAAVDKWTT
jgi:hypothetical protein